VQRPALDVLYDQMADVYDRTRFRAAATVLRLTGISKVMLQADDV
jgi:hypothetical protein